MTKTTRQKNDEPRAVTPEEPVTLVSEDHAGEFQATFSFVIDSKGLIGPQFMTIADELEKHAAEVLEHATIISKQIDYLDGQTIPFPR